MIYWKLFLTFLEIGAVCFGGGYGMISLIREKVLLNGWLTEEEILNMIAISESTPGPLAVNMATFIGNSQGGLLVAILATFGVVLPSFIVILLIASLINNLLKYKGVKAFLGGIKPCVIALIVATAVTTFLSIIFNIKTIDSNASFNYKGLIILLIIISIDLLFNYKINKKISPIALIILSAILGIVFYSL